MKKTGITRKIDELGRIVIPKEIRKNLKIRNNDELLISVNDENIVLSKYMQFSSDDVLSIFIRTISNMINKNVLITSKDKVLVSSNILFKNLELSNNITSKIENREVISSLIPSKISLFNEIIEVSYMISPFTISYDVVGSVIVFSSDEIDSISVFSVNLITSFLENYLEE